MRYIDADAFKQKLADKDIFFPALYKNELDEMPTADVAPKSEADMLHHLLKDAWKRIEELDNLCGELQKAKTDVAREIFAELEFDIANLDFDREETRAIAIEGIIAELKKKYTEENENVQT